MSLADQPHLYIVSVSMLFNVIFLIFILYNYRERKKLHKLLNEVNHSIKERNHAMSKHAAQLEEAYENLKKINQKLEEKVHLGTDQVTFRHKKLLEYIKSSIHKIRGTLASLAGLLLLAQNEEMSKNLNELIQMMKSCIRQSDEIVRDFSEKLEDKA